GDLAEGGRLLVAEDARDRGLAQQALGLGVAVHLGGGADVGQHRAGNAERFAQFVIPVEGCEIHEQGAGGVRDVGRVHAAVHAAREVPEHPRVGRAEGELATLGALAGALDVVEDPGDLGGGEVGRERQPGLLGEAPDAALGGERVHGILRAGVLPDDRVVDGLARRAIPHDHGLALVGDADRGHLVTRDAGIREGHADHVPGGLPDLGGVVLDPAGPREMLPMLALARTDDAAAVVEDDRAGARGSLVDRDDVAGAGNGGMQVRERTYFWPARAAMRPRSTDSRDEMLRSEHSLTYARPVALPPEFLVVRERARPLAPEERREAILDAVLPLLRERGREVTSRELAEAAGVAEGTILDRKSTRLNSSHVKISYAVFCLK